MARLARYAARMPTTTLLLLATIGLVLGILAGRYHRERIRRRTVARVRVSLAHWLTRDHTEQATR